MINSSRVPVRFMLLMRSSTRVQKLMVMRGCCFARRSSRYKSEGLVTARRNSGRTRISNTLVEDAAPICRIHASFRLEPFPAKDVSKSTQYIFMIIVWSLYIVKIKLYGYFFIGYNGFIETSFLVHDDTRMFL